MTLWELGSLVIPELLDENFKSRWPEAYEFLNNSKLGPSAFPTDDLPPDLIRDALAFWPYHYVLRSGRLEALYDGPSIVAFASGTVRDSDRPKLPPNALSAVGVFDRFGAEAIYTAHEKAVWDVPEGMHLSAEEREPVLVKSISRPPGIRPLPGYSKKKLERQ